MRLSISQERKQLATEYLCAFIKYLYDKGKSGFEIARKLRIHSNLLEKLVKDQAMMSELKKRNETYAREKLKQFENEQYPDWKMRENYGISVLKDGTFQDDGGDYRNLDTWINGYNFTNSVEYHYRYKRNYSPNDVDVIVELKTGVKLPEDRFRLADRELSPQHKMRLIYDLSDGVSVWEVSEKYNCSAQTVRQTAAEHGLAIPAADDAVAERIVKAIKEGYDIEQLKSRFRNFNVQKIRKLIEEHRITPAMEAAK